MEQPDEHDPDATVWSAVAELEQKGYTKIEITAVLTNVAKEMLKSQQAL